MVRKRTRKYNSDDNDSDSDVDFDYNQAVQEPAAKKYSLRERKRAPVITTDLDYYDLDEEEEIKKQSSDDEDFEVEADVPTSRSYFEPEPGPQNSEGLIDFEDIIRADIVVNKNKIDYDNLIQKSEITLTQPKKRGRKPKNYVEPKPVQENNVSEKIEQEESKDGQEQTEVGQEKSQDSQEGSQDGVQAEINFCEGQDGTPNGDVSEKVAETDPLAMINANNVIKPPLENVIKQDDPPPEEDDDVIVLGELKHDVIVLDD